MTSSTVYFVHLVGLLCLSAVVGLQHNVRRGHGVYGPRGGPGGDGQRQHGQHRLQQPYFDRLIDPETGQGSRNVTTVEGGTAILLCTVRHLGPNDTVSWIRKARHPVVLSSGTAVFTSDRRVRISHPGDAWRLKVDPVLRKDRGLYECQVNTRDKMSLVFKLNVEPAQAQLDGESSVYVKEGSTISLTCSINLYSVPPPDITWMHGAKVLNFDSPRGGISLETEKTRTGTTSKLLVTRATVADSGPYTCDPSRGQRTTADVHIITDEHPAELQDGLTSSAAGSEKQISLLTLGCAMFLCWSHATSQ